MAIIIKSGTSKKDLLAILKTLDNTPFKGIDTKKYCGKLKLKKDALKTQKEMRDEWS